MIALAVPDLDIAYFAELAKHVMAEAERQGSTTLLLETGGRREKELAAVQGFDAQFTDGVILSPLALLPRDLEGRDTRLPLVLLGECNLPGSADHVAIDNVAAAREATAHLLARGRRRIAVVGGDLRGTHNTGRLRTVGHRQALTEAGLAVSEELILPVPAFRWADGAAAARTLMRLPEPPDALLCLNDHLALGAVRALHEDGWSVPGDVDVVGFDDIEATRYSIPTLTTVAPDKPGIARRAVELLRARIEAAGPGGPAVDETAGHRLIVRESSGG